MPSQKLRNRDTVTNILAKLLRRTPAQFDRTRRDFLAAGVGGSAALLVPRLAHSAPRAGAGPRVAVVGGGLAGLSCAYSLSSRGFNVQVLEGRNRLGGRVVTVRAPGGEGRAEGGGEFIGNCHSFWHAYAEHFGLELEPVAEGDEGDEPVFVDGVALSAAAARAVGEESRGLCLALNDLAAQVNPWRAWESHGAHRLDRISMADWLQQQQVSTLCARLFGGSLQSSNAVPLARQSLLAQLVQIKGGEFDAYWEATRDQRCRGGNARLADKLADGIGRQHVRLGTRVAGIEQHGARLRVREAPGGQQDFDFVVLAVPPSVWSNIAMDGVAPACVSQMGTAVKNIAWLTHQKNPQVRIAGAELTTAIWPAKPVGASTPLIRFSGGPHAVQASALSAEARGRVYGRELPPSFATAGNASTPCTFVDWLKDDLARGSYSFPDLGEITTRGPLWEDGVAQLQFAGEHTCYPFIGFMEGALRSGVRAAENILRAAR